MLALQWIVALVGREMLDGAKCCHTGGQAPPPGEICLNRAAAFSPNCKQNMIASNRLGTSVHNVQSECILGIRYSRISSSLNNASRLAAHFYHLL